MTEGLVRRFSLCRLIATLGILCVIVGVIVLAGESPFLLVHPPSAMTVSGITFFLLLGTYGTDFLRFIPDSVLTLFCSPLKPNPRFAAIAKSGMVYAIGAGLTGTLIGIIVVLKKLEDPSQIGPGIAFALFSMLLAVVLSQIFFAFVYDAYRPRETG